MDLMQMNIWGSSGDFRKHATDLLNPYRDASHFKYVSLSLEFSIHAYTNAANLMYTYGNQTYKLE